MERVEPLTESYFYILLCVSGEPMHGYGIMQETARMTENHLKIGSGTMYGAISNMMKREWILEMKSTSPEDYRKRVYQITPEGRQALEQEYHRLEKMTENARDRLGRI